MTVSPECEKLRWCGGQLKPSLNSRRTVLVRRSRQRWRNGVGRRGLDVAVGRDHRLARVRSRGVGALRDERRRRDRHGLSRSPGSTSGSRRGRGAALRGLGEQVWLVRAFEYVTIAHSARGHACSHWRGDARITECPHSLLCSVSLTLNRSRPKTPGKEPTSISFVLYSLITGSEKKLRPRAGRGYSRSRSTLPIKEVFSSRGRGMHR